MATPSYHVQSYFIGLKPDEEGKCDYYWPLEDMERLNTINDA
jgi:hypothetical protein